MVPREAGSAMVRTKRAGRPDFSENHAAWFANTPHAPPKRQRPAPIRPAQKQSARVVLTGFTLALGQHLRLVFVFEINIATLSFL